MEEKISVTQEQITELTIADLLRRWPKTAVLFQKHNMACVGCVVAPFYSVEDAISIYGLSRDVFLEELMQLMQT